MEPPWQNVVRKGQQSHEIHPHAMFSFPGLLCLSVYSTVGILYYDYWDWPRLFFYLLRGFSEWLFIIGVYGVTRQLVTRPLPGLARLSELAMPFYLTHQQLLVPIAAACSWVPYLSKGALTSDLTVV